jgi:hypothetical protein
MVYVVGKISGRWRHASDPPRVEFMAALPIALINVDVQRQAARRR